MSFNGYKTLIEEDDTVILYLTITQIYTVSAVAKTISKKGKEVDNVFQTPYGALKCADLIGKPYGSRIQLSQGWGYVMQPTPELWTLTLPHRTQIIYTPDISMIILQLEISPGSVVVESGTGSGSLSHALIRAVKPHGHLFTFDFHKNRVVAAQNEFIGHGLSDFVTVGQRDVCANGFGEDLEDKADAVFLDLPQAWQAIPHTVSVLKNVGGRICSFSPCIEQVQRSCEVLNRLGFQEIQTVEVLQTSYLLQNRRMSILNLDFVKSAKDGSEVSKEKEVWQGVTAVPPMSMAGHTGYLTFGTMPPVWARKVHISYEEEDGQDVQTFDDSV